MARKHVLAFSSLLVVLVSPINARAQTSASAGTTAAPTNVIEEEQQQLQRFGLTLGVQTDSSLHQSDDVSHSSSTSLTIAPSYKISKKVKVAGSLTLIRDYENQEEPNQVNNAKVTLSHSRIVIGQGWFVTPAVAGTAPTSRVAREDLRLNGSFSLEPRLSYAPENSKFSGFYHLSLNRNFHEQTLSRGSSPNLEYSYTSILGAEYEVIPKLAFTLMGRYTIGKTYRNFQREHFSIMETINYQINDELGVEVGHSNSGSAVKPNQRDSNIAVLSDQGSTLFIGANYVF
jgi:hypothetical protein